MESLALNLRHAALVLLCAALSACAAGEDYHAPNLGLPEAWSALKAAPADKAKPGEAEHVEYWKHFNDATLDALIAQAEANNHDYKIAVARMREARAQRVATAAAQYPQVNGTSNPTRGSQENFFTGKPFGLYDANFDATWEADMFGGNKRKAEAASATAEGAEAQVRGALISLRAEVARTYFELRNLQAQLRITQETAKSQQQTWDIARQMQAAGAVSGLDAAQAEAQYETTQARVPDLQAQLAAAKNQLAVLLGEPPEALDASLDEDEPIPVMSSAVVVATPAAVIAQRPDVKAAERELAAKTALHGAAIADLYPKLSLSALFGTMDSSFFTGGRVKEWSLGAGLTAPLFNAGRIRANIRASDAEAQAAFDTYRQTVLKALAEVETSLTNYLKEDEKRASLQRAADAAMQATVLATERYRKGLDPFVNVLTAERAEFEAESALAASDAKVAEDLVAVYKGLGV